MFNICESNNFLWSSRNNLGIGATATVYQGIHKSSGDAVAVKCYNDYINGPELQIREFEVLKKVRHENVVKLIAIEENIANRKKVIIMELCNGGSLLTDLLKPENAYGLMESEFLLVLKHLCNGMKYLRDNNIIHRDLKPGNIMKCIQEDGCSVYKLTDFGAAREMRDEETFQSLCGTEQYLHPDLYERAVLKRQIEKKFYASTDLWSIGITLYHVVTGTLPFRVYSSSRSKEVLHYITTQKESGVISGVQIKDNSPIKWSKELPEDCLLSESMRKSIQTMIAGLLEADCNKMWGFDRFFKEVEFLLSHISIDIFYVNKAKLIKLYMLPDQKYEDLQHHIKDQTKIDEPDQILLYKNNPIKNYILDSTLISQYPETREGSPLFLFSKANETFSEKPIEIPEWEDFAVNISVQNDIAPAKNACIIGYYCKRHIDKYATYCKLIGDSIENFIDYLDKDIKEIQLMAQHLYEKICILKTPASLLQQLSKTNGANENAYYSRLKGMAEEFARGTALEVTNLYNVQCIEKNLISEWNDMTKNLRNPFKNCGAIKVKTQVEELQKFWQHFMMQPITQHLSYGEGQWHILERKKIRQTLSDIINLLQVETFPQYEQMAKTFEDWYKFAQKQYCEINNLRLEIEQYEEKLKQFEIEFTASYKSSVKNNQQHLAKFPDTRKVTNSEHFEKCWNEYYNNKKKFGEVLSENSRLMNKIQDFTMNFRI